MSKLNDMKRRVKRLQKHPDKTWDPNRKTPLEIWEARLTNHLWALDAQYRIQAAKEKKYGKREAAQRYHLRTANSSAGR